jgi:hypothetical protein
MNKRIEDLIAQIKSLEDELLDAIHEGEAKANFTLKGKSIEFAQEVKQAHRKIKRSLMTWLVTDRPQNLLTGPIIYAMIVPLAITDLCVSFYQATCFPIYGIQKVKRANYFIYDRHKLGYLNLIEKFHCEYCAYANGLMAYLSEIIARTELYFCPIKHARKVIGTHGHYSRFMDYGDSKDFHQKWFELRRRGGPDHQEQASKDGMAGGER